MAFKKGIFEIHIRESGLRNLPKKDKKLIYQAGVGENFVFAFVIYVLFGTFVFVSSGKKDFRFHFHETEFSFSLTPDLNLRAEIC